MNFGRPNSTRCALLASMLLPLGCPSEAGSGTETTESTGPAPTTSTTEPAETTTTAPAEESTTTAVADSSSSETTLAAESSSETTAADSTSTGAEGIADLDMSVVVEDTLASIYTQTLDFAPDACPVIDGCLPEGGTRRLLRFDTITPNLGDADFFVGNATDNPELFEPSACTGSFLFANYARYRLLDSKGVEVGTGHKSAFALIDLAPFTKDAGPAQYGFGGDMGISVGWADIYGAGLDCQWVDITGVVAGDYTLELSINPDQVVPEASYENNILLLPVTITDDIPPPPKEWVCPDAFYGTNDGCDCGCGVVDPDCEDTTLDSCDVCNAGCAMVCNEIDPENNAVCLG